MRVGNFSKRGRQGFTIVELLIVIVVIGILAAIVLVTYNGSQQRARDSRRQNDVQILTQGLELYYLTNGNYPAGSGSTTIDASWSTTADASWQNLVNLLKPYMGNVPSDPISTPGVSMTNTSSVGYNYAYFSGTACGTTGTRQFYILIYRLESSPQANVDNGTCSSAPVGPYANASNYRTMK